MSMKGLFGAPPAPTPTPPPVMPDPNSPAVLAARRDAMGQAQRGGRASTTLTTPLAAGGTYSATKLGS